ncbi:hypothetical protein ACSBR2_025850 [Camellia fascicularis]
MDEEHRSGILWLGKLYSFFMKFPRRSFWGVKIMIMQMHLKGLAWLEQRYDGLYTRTRQNQSHEDEHRTKGDTTRTQCFLNVHRWLRGFQGLAIGILRFE